MLPRIVFCLNLVVLLLSPPTAAAESEFPFPAGQIVSNGQVQKLREWLPEAFWAHRQYFFHDGMALEIGPIQRDYAPPSVYREATQRFRGTARISSQGALEGYRAGQPFPAEAIDCSGDPQAGVEYIWNFMHRWQGFGVRASFRYNYFDRGELLPLMYAGSTSAWLLKYRPEPQFAENSGDVFPREERVAVVGFEVEEPKTARGTRTLTYRYVDSLGPPETARPEDTWIYSSEIRRVRKISQTQRSSAVGGTDFSFDDLFSFSGLPPQYHWRCIGERRVIAPMNTKQLGYPYAEKVDFGPSGFSFASDRWELRDAVVLEMKAKDPKHPYQRKELWLDRQTLEPLYSFAYDRSGALWKIIYHNHRWSEDDLGEIKAREWYAGWEGVPEPRDLRVVADVVVNVQTGTGNRLDFWDSHGTPPKLSQLRRYVDVQRLRHGR